MTTVSSSQVATSEHVPAAQLPAHVEDALGDLAGAAREGLLALSVGVGLRVLAPCAQCLAPCPEVEAVEVV